MKKYNGWYILVSRKMSTLISESTEQPNQKILRNVSSLETKTDQESNNTNSKSEQTISPAFKPQLDQLYTIDGIKLLITKLSKL